jgi:hypothetical protein
MHCDSLSVQNKINESVLGTFMHDLLVSLPDPENETESEK